MERDDRPGSFELAYPRLSRWIGDRGWIELGQDHYSRSLVRVLDEGGMIRESAAEHRTLDDALRAAEVAVVRWLREQFGER
jgi:hypothetical protein